MTITYTHPYGGKAVDLGPFSVEEFFAWAQLQEGLDTSSVTVEYLLAAPLNTKILDLFGDKREVLVYKPAPWQVNVTVINK